MELKSDCSDPEELRSHLYDSMIIPGFKMLQVTDSWPDSGPIIAHHGPESKRTGSEK